MRRRDVVTSALDGRARRGAGRRLSVSFFRPRQSAGLLPKVLLDSWAVFCVIWLYEYSFMEVIRPDCKLRFRLLSHPGYLWSEVGPSGYLEGDHKIQ